MAEMPRRDFVGLSAKLVQIGGVGLSTFVPARGHLGYRIHGPFCGPGPIANFQQAMTGRNEEKPRLQAATANLNACRRTKT
ncbi:hypothetical protein Mnod_8314 (plasmid) [Methylobacterium nodulans ORS 2060]|uniref:Uncharacterized protein n=1 Tax=Methylobacterium nodulans (strain LMG 21967 / CNCM I-2342 / ORS 2060) TaxID=460265 RepID=B8IVL6_METNO|nr:hypothetical protein Mnod_8314 [Methylobacterium nodulans ORS 2060]